jgi:hypothetical protein
VTEVDHERAAKPLAPDRETLWKLIRKEDPPA